MSAPDDRGASTADRIAEEHHRIFKAVGELEGFLGAGAVMSPDNWVSTITRRLGELGEGLAPHFRFERESALQSEVPDRVPHLAAKLERLMAEHQTFLTELGAIIAAGRSALDPDDALVRQLSARTGALLSNLRRHESEENDILAAAFQDDLGVGD